MPFEMRSVERVQGTEEQESIWDVMKQVDGPNLMVEALAGTGKTFTMTEGLKKLMGEISRGARIAFIAFNRSVADELMGKVPRGVWTNTSNGLGYRVIRENVERVEFDQDKTWDIINELRDEMGINSWRKGQRPAIRQLVEMLKQVGFDPRPSLTEESLKLMDDLCFKYDIRWRGSSTELYEYALRVLRTCLKRLELVDYSDQLWVPYVLEMEIPEFDMLVVDEAQDLNRVQQQLCLRLGKRILVVGDRYQCHPEGTRVLVTGRGYVPIEELRVGDELASYNSQKSYSPGHTSQGREVQAIQSRRYCGWTIEGNGLVTTPNHRWLVRLSEKGGGRWAVYLMVDDRGIPRIGTTKLLGVNGFLPGLRARQENAEHLWVLDTFETWEEARKTEWMLSLRYRISQRAEYSQSLDEWAVELEHHLSADRVSELLSVYNRLKEFPFWTRGGSEHAGKYSFMCRACNLMNNCMEVVRVTGPKECVWEELRVENGWIDGKVYSLQVEPAENGRRLYIAEELVTGNSIYGFRGADTESMETFKGELSERSAGVRVLPLTTCWRCPKSVIEVAQKMVPGIRAKKGAAEGVVEIVRGPRMYQDLRPGDMMLCRTNVPLLQMVYRLWKDKRRAFLKGRDVESGLVRMIERFEDDCMEKTLPELNRWIDFYEEGEREKIMARKGSNGQLIGLEEKCDCLRVMVDNTSCTGSGDVDRLKESMKFLFGSKDKDARKYIQGSSVHRAKGLEAERVVILEPGLMPHPMAVQDWERDQEMNIAYVACTRAKDTLWLVDSTSPFYGEGPVRIPQRPAIQMGPMDEVLEEWDAEDRIRDILDLE